MPDRNVIRLHELSAEANFAESRLEHADVWEMGRDGYFTYRIPSLCMATGGTILAFAEARRSDFCRSWGWRKEWNADEVHCVMKRSTDNGRTWSEQECILGNGSDYEVRDPSPVVDADTGQVHLVARGPYIMTSADEGETWSAPRSLRHLIPPSLSHLTPGPANSGVQLRYGRHAGRLIYAVAAEGDIGVMYSDDHGEHWQLGGMITDHDVYEPQIAELADGRILINSRNHSDTPGRLISTSHDGGISFESCYDDRLPSQRCEASFLQYPAPMKTPEMASQPVIFCGPAEGRRKLVVKLSSDGCQSWQTEQRIYSGHSAYSAMAALPDNQVGILYEKDAYRRLSFVTLDLPNK
jgi:sialidase-1